MKKLPFLALVLLFFHANSQYYYKDLVATADISRLMKTYNANNVKKVIARGITPDGGAAADFTEVGEINANGASLKVTTTNNKENAHERLVIVPVIENLASRRS